MRSQLLFTTLALLQMACSAAIVLIPGVTCGWVLDVVQINESDLVAVQAPSKPVSVSRLVTELGIVQINCTETPCYSYTYFVRLRIFCNGKESPVISRHMAMLGVKPIVKMHFDPVTLPGRFLGHTEHHLIAAYTDHNRLFVNSDPGAGCMNMSLCQPLWLLPLPIDGYTPVLLLEVTTTGLGSLPDQRFQIHIDGIQLNADTSLSNGSFGNLSTLDPQLTEEIMTANLTLQMYTTGKYPISVIVGERLENYMIITRDEFESFITLKCLLEYQRQVTIIYSAVPLPGRLILLTDVGVFEVIGNLFQNQAQLDINHISNKTMKVIALPNMLAHFPKILMAENTPDNASVYLADIPPQKGSKLALSQALDVNSSSVCKVLEPSSGRLLSCQVLAATATRDVYSSFVILLHTTYTNKNASFVILKYAAINNNPSWTILSRISTIPKVSKEKTTLMSVTEDNLDVHEQVTLNITGLASTQIISQHLYMWGSHLLHSPDGGIHWYILKHFDSQQSITVFITSEKGNFAFLTDQKEIWFGIVGISTVQQLYPSEEWDIIHFLNRQELQGANTTTVSLYFNFENQLIQVMSHISNNGSMKLTTAVIPAEDILRQRTYINRADLKYHDSHVHNDASVIEPTGAVDDCAASRHGYSIIRRSCPFTKLLFEMPHAHHYNRIRGYTLSPPRITLPMSLHNKESLTAYQAIVYLFHHLDRHSNHTYDFLDSDHVSTWKRSKTEKQLFSDFMFANHYSKSDIEISVDDYEKFLDAKQTELLKEVFLDRHQQYVFKIHISLESDHQIATSEYNFPELEQLQLSIELSDTSLVNITTVRSQYFINDSVAYQVTIADAGVYNTQNPPGGSLVGVGVLFHLWQSAFHCHINSPKPNTPQGTYTLNVMLGCPPTQRMVFDMESTISNLTLLKETHFDCPNVDPNMPCLYFQNGFHPYFKVLDEVTGLAEHFLGSYTLKVVGGGTGSVTNIREFTQEQVFQYNNQNVRSASKIWSSVNLETTNADGWSVYTHTHNAISWLCQPESACANVQVDFPHAPEYYFLVEFSNKDVDRSSTNCDYTMRFILHVHGLPIDSIRVSMLLVCISIMFMCSGMAVYYTFRRNDNHLWKTLIRTLKSKKVSPVDTIPLALRQQMTGSALYEDEDQIIEEEEEDSESERYLGPRRSLSSIADAGTEFSYEEEMLHSSKSSAS